MASFCEAVQHQHGHHAGAMGTGRNVLELGKK